MILWVGIIQEWIDCSQSIPMNFIINHSLHRVAQNLHCNTPFIVEAKENFKLNIEISKSSIFKEKTHRINFIYKHTEICGPWIIATQVWMAGFHTIIISFLDLFWGGIWKLVAWAKKKNRHQHYPWYQKNRSTRTVIEIKYLFMKLKYLKKK